MRQGTRKLGSKFSFIDESGGEYLPWRACSTNRIEGINSFLLAIVALSRVKLVVSFRPRYASNWAIVPTFLDLSVGIDLSKGNRADLESEKPIPRKVSNLAQWLSPTHAKKRIGRDQVN